MTPDTSSSSRIQSIAALLLVALALALLLTAQTPPSPLPADAPATEFSATRALAVQQRLFSPERPHPLGSVESAAIRARIVAELGALGLSPEVRSRAVCAPYGVCGLPYNILARVPGRNPGQLVVLATHYDSVFAGPGAGDAAASVGAILEIARALKAGPPLEHDVLLLIDDGEEAGLLGARAFLQEPEAAQVRAYINMEARGSRGLSRLFETSDGNATFARLFAEHLPHPSTSSLFFEIYKLLPNDTDLSVFRAGGGTGIGMAFAEGATHYHTPLDNLANLDPRTVQDQGESALALARAFVAHPGSLKADGDAVYFDVVGRQVLAWPATWSWLLILAGAGLVGAWRFRLGADRPGFGATVGAAALQLGVLLMVGACAFIVHRTFRSFDLLPMRWQANLEGMSLYFALIGVLLAGLAVRLRLLQRLTPLTALHGLSLVLLVASILLQEFLPGAVYLALAPLLATALMLAVFPRALAFAAGVAGAALLVVFGPLLVSLYDLLGSGLLFVVAPLAALVALPVLQAVPLTFLRAPVWLVLLVLVLVKTSVDAVRAPFDANTPMPLAISVVQQPDHIGLTYQTEVDPRHHRVIQAVGRGHSMEQAFPWSSGRVLASTPDDGVIATVPTPEVQVLGQTPAEGGLVSWRLSIRSLRDADMVGLAMPASIPRSAVRVNGAAVTEGAKYNRDAGQQFLPWTVYAGSAEFVVTLSAGTIPTGYVFDRKAGLPASAERYAAGRADVFAVPAHGGDAHWAIAPLVVPEATVP